LASIFLTLQDKTDAPTCWFQCWFQCWSGV